MDYTIGTTGKTIVARLEDGEPLYATIEKIAIKEKIQHAMVWAIGGIQNASVVVGPKDPDKLPLEILTESFDKARELLGVGTLFCNAKGEPKLHMHAAMGKGNQPLVGCPRLGAECWLVQEVIIMEINGVRAKRLVSEESHLELLKIL